jgi:hypothetical protein
MHSMGNTTPTVLGLHRLAESHVGDVMLAFIGRSSRLL